MTRVHVSLTLSEARYLNQRLFFAGPVGQDIRRIVRAAMKREREKRKKWRKA